MNNPFNWEYLTRVPKAEEAYGPFAIAFVIVFVVGLATTLVAGRILSRSFKDHALNRRLAARGSQIMAWVFGVGLLFFALRALEIPLLGMRLWLYLSALAVLVAIALGIWYMQARYPAALRAHEEQEQRQQYLRTGTRRRATAGRRRR
jgi:hypothetical protein